MAPTGQTSPQRLQEYKQYPNRGIKTGVKSPLIPDSVTDACSAPVGQERMHKPQRMHVSSISSSFTPGGLIKKAGGLFEELSLSKTASPVRVMMPAVNKALRSASYGYFSGREKPAFMNITFSGQEEMQSMHMVHSAASEA